MHNKCDREDSQKSAFWAVSAPSHSAEGDIPVILKTRKTTVQC